MTELDPERIFGTLERHGVDYVLIGALAVAAHGYVRSTRDVDFPIETRHGRLDVMQDKTSSR